MLIMCEGVDGGGKSTLAHAISERYYLWCSKHHLEPNLTLLKKGQPDVTVSGIEEYERPLEEEPLRSNILSLTSLVLMDRWHTGEQFYGPLYRGQSRLSDGDNLHVELTLEALGTVKLLVQPTNVNTIRNRIQERGEDFLLPEHLKQVHHGYEEHADRYIYVRATAERAESYLQMARHNTQVTSLKTSFSHWPGYVGSPTPTLLLVGDQRNDGPRATTWSKRAFTPALAGGSSSYLMKALYKLDPTTIDDLGLVNANELGVDLTELNRLEDPPAVVALGTNASAALTTAGVEHERVPHPQWWRRFRYSDLDGYVNKIMEASGVPVYDH